MIKSLFAGLLLIVWAALAVSATADNEANPNPFEAEPGQDMESGRARCYNAGAVLNSSWVKLCYWAFPV